MRSMTLRSLKMRLFQRTEPFQLDRGGMAGAIFGQHSQHVERRYESGKA